MKMQKKFNNFNRRIQQFAIRCFGHPWPASEGVASGIKKCFTILYYISATQPEEPHT
jgi:hypothetical protein